VRVGARRRRRDLDVVDVAAVRAGDPRGADRVLDGLRESLGDGAKFITPMMTISALTPTSTPPIAMTLISDNRLDPRRLRR
jgi:hypothetical protein